MSASKISAVEFIGHGNKFLKLTSWLSHLLANDCEIERNVDELKMTLLKVTSCKTKNQSNSVSLIYFIDKNKLLKKSC